MQIQNNPKNVETIKKNIKSQKSGQTKKQEIFKNEKMLKVYV